MSVNEQQWPPSGATETKEGVVHNLGQQPQLDSTDFREIEKPMHYNMGKIQPIDVIRDWKLSFCLGNTVKYIARAEHKGDKLKDLKKALQYIKFEIDFLEGKR